MRPALARHDALARTAVEGHRGTVVKMTGDGALRGVRRSARCGRGHAAVAAGARRSRGDRWRRAARALRAARGRRRAPRQRLLRQRRQPCGAHHGGGARRPGAAVAGGGRPGGGSAAGRGVAARPGRGAAARSGESRARLSGRASRSCGRTFPALRSLEATPNNLPQQVTSFVGRERELAEVSSCWPKRGC